jgi:hypothetical protein
MHLKRATCASAILIGVGLSTLTAGAGLAIAQPGGPPPCGPQGGTCQGPGGGGPGGGRGGGPGGGPPPQQQQQGDRGGPGGPGGFGGPGGPGDRGGPGGPDDHGGPGGPQFGGPGRPDDHGGFGGPNGPGGGPGYHGGPGGPEWGPPPPDLGWRGIDQGRLDHQPFNYNGNWVQPIYNQDYNNWGFWFFGIWIPL